MAFTGSYVSLRLLATVADVQTKWQSLSHTKTKLKNLSMYF